MMQPSSPVDGNVADLEKKRHYQWTLTNSQGLCNQSTFRAVSVELTRVMLSRWDHLLHTCYLYSSAGGGQEVNVAEIITTTKSVAVMHVTGLALHRAHVFARGLPD